MLIACAGLQDGRASGQQQELSGDCRRLRDEHQEVQDAAARRLSGRTQLVLRPGRQVQEARERPIHTSTLRGTKRGSATGEELQRGARRAGKRKSPAAVIRQEARWPGRCSCRSRSSSPPASRCPRNSSPGIRRSRARPGRRVEGHQRAEPALHHVFGHRLQRSGRTDVRERGEHRLAAQRDGELHAHDQLGNGDEQGDVRPQAGQQSRVVEVRTRLGGRHAHAANLRQTHIVNGKYAWHIDGNGPPVAVPPELAEIYQLDLWLNPHGFLKAARMPGANPSRVALGADREGARRQRRDAREGPRRRHHGARQVPRRRHDQQPEHHHPHQDDGERERAGRLQHRARVDRVRPRRPHRGGPSTGTHIRDGTTTGSSIRRAPATTPTAESSRTCRPTSATIRCRCPSR